MDKGSNMEYNSDNDNNTTNSKSSKGLSSPDDNVHTELQLSELATTTNVTTSDGNDDDDTIILKPENQEQLDLQDIEQNNDKTNHTTITNPESSKGLSSPDDNVHTELQLSELATTTNVTTSDGHDHTTITNPESSKGLSSPDDNVHNELQLPELATTTNVTTSDGNDDDDTIILKPENQEQLDLQDIKKDIEQNNDKTNHTTIINPESLLTDTELILDGDNYESSSDSDEKILIKLEKDNNESADNSDEFLINRYKRNRNVLNLKKRVQVIEAYINDKSTYDQLAQKFSCGWAQIKSIISNREKILKEFKEDKHKSSDKDDCKYKKRFQKRNVLNLKTRVEVIEAYNNGELTFRQLAQKFRCGKDQIQKIINGSEQILKEFEENNDDSATLQGTSNDVSNATNDFDTSKQTDWKPNVLSLNRRVHVIEAYNKSNGKLSVRKLAKKFRCGRDQINYIISNREQILKEYKMNDSPSTTKALGGRKVLNLKERLDVIKTYNNDKLSIRQLAEIFNSGRDQIWRIIRDRCKILEDYKEQIKREKKLILKKRKKAKEQKLRNGHNLIAKSFDKRIKKMPRDDSDEDIKDKKIIINAALNTNYSEYKNAQNTDDDDDNYNKMEIMKNENQDENHHYNDDDDVDIKTEVITPENVETEIENKNISNFGIDNKIESMESDDDGGDDKKIESIENNRESDTNVNNSDHDSIENDGEIETNINKSAGI